MYEGLQSLLRLDNAALVRDNSGMIKKVFMEQLQDIISPRPTMQAAPMPPAMSQPAFVYTGGSVGLSSGNSANNAKIQQSNEVVDGDDFVIDAYTVSAMGNGNSAAGGKVLDEELPSAPNTDNSFNGMIAFSESDGMKDDIEFDVQNGGEIKKAMMSNGEYVVDKNQVALVGGGSVEQGTQNLDKLREEIRQQAYGSKEQPKEIVAAKTVRDLLNQVG